MIIRSASTIPVDKLASTCWARLRRFHNVAYVKERICELHEVPKKHADNVKKQAEQLRYCLIQAKEYYDAAAAVTLATKPVLLYYSIMSLALAEILFKQDGMSSLDKARGEHAHHGLEIRIDPAMKAGAQASTSLRESAAQLRAVPPSRDGKRFGTFELWHRTCRELPLAGQSIQVVAGGLQSVTSPCALLLAAADTPLGDVPTAGVTLLECMEYLPTMRAFMAAHQIMPRSLRAKIEARVMTDQNYSDVVVTIQPAPQILLDELYSNIRMKASDFECIDINYWPSGITIIMKNWHGLSTNVSFPYGVNVSKDEVLFFPANHSLNEFGLFYAALYIAGNYARYFPDRWLADVDLATALALGVEELIAQAVERVPLLALCELTRICFIPD